VEKSDLGAVTSFPTQKPECPSKSEQPTGPLGPSLGNQRRSGKYGPTRVGRPCHESNVEKQRSKHEAKSKHLRGHPDENSLVFYAATRPRRSVCNNTYNNGLRAHERSAVRKRREPPKMYLHGRFSWAGQWANGLL
jgi:hypothetical protein